MQTPPGQVVQTSPPKLGPKDRTRAEGSCASTNNVLNVKKMLRKGVILFLGREETLAILFVCKFE